VISGDDASNEEPFGDTAHQESRTSHPVVGAGPCEVVAPERSKSATVYESTGYWIRKTGFSGYVSLSHLTGYVSISDLPGIPACGGERLLENQRERGERLAEVLTIRACLCVAL
jgi:hypothetical protein